MAELSCYTRKLRTHQKCTPVCKSRRPTSPSSANSVTCTESQSVVKWLTLLQPQRPLIGHIHISSSPQTSDRFDATPRFVLPDTGWYRRYTFLIPFLSGCTLFILSMSFSSEQTYDTAIEIDLHTYLLSLTQHHWQLSSSSPLTLTNAEDMDIEYLQGRQSNLIQRVSRRDNNFLRWLLEIGHTESDRDFLGLQNKPYLSGLLTIPPLLSPTISNAFS
jgi:hypothetical protein